MKNITPILFLLALIHAPLHAHGAQTSSGKIPVSDQIPDHKLCNIYFPLYEEAFGIPKNLLKAISVTESGHRHKNIVVSWPWTINVDGKSYRFANKTTAIKAVETLQAQGKKSIDIGCMQVNLKHHPKAFSSLDQAFDPKYNVGYAATFLRSNYRKYKSWDKASELYHSADADRGNDYLQKVYANWGHGKAPKKSHSSFKVSIRNAEPTQENISNITSSVLKNFE